MGLRASPGQATPAGPGPPGGRGAATQRRAVLGLRHPFIVYAGAVAVPLIAGRARVGQFNHWTWHRPQADDAIEEAQRCGAVSSDGRQTG